MSDPHDLFRKATLATQRALSGQQDIPLTPALASLERAALTPEEIAYIRGATDAAALQQRHHDPAKRVTLADAQTQIITDGMEQARCEIYGSRHMAGVRANINNHLARRLYALNSARMMERADMPAPLALELLTREALSGQTLPEEITGPALAEWRQALGPKARAALETLALVQDDQSRFHQATQHFVKTFTLEETGQSDEEEPESSSSRNQNQSEDSEAGESASPDPQGEEEEEGSSDDEHSILNDEAEDSTSSGEDPASDEIEALLAEGENGFEQPAGPSEMREDEPPCPITGLGGYHAYTQEFDEEIHAHELCDPTELDRLREKLDEQLQQTQGFVSRLAHRLQRKLLAQQQRRWHFDQEDGILDAARLPRIISNPSLPLSYKQEGKADFRDTVVTLLIDNSGSMRGRPITTAAICGDILARTLERCGIKVEVLGFTTRAWKGGQSRVKWSEDGRPKEPGRLNDLRHIIYKSADTPWRRARRNIGLMLREGLLKENIDGEALLWAWKRLKHRPEHRRILMVISDGAPVDDSTSSANGPEYLDLHLHRVIHQLENDHAGELLAIGIGHDVTRYYANSVTISSAEDLGDTMVAQLTALFAPPSGKTKRRG
ncbi:cobaltochelatase CobT-related protein [Bombella sp. ESL0385]|uniref:cobaltochelatase CobT-related protein n=1 Tax=Bombella sp. ESL0385 TaxID=2676446 RepID=UPI0012D9F83B|nr:cobaltochelatase subunit CobT [Bombella sp. ESL0385]MUG90349.1 cobaltochelatase subunit CobT [Bombella sp. ESL0385]